MTPATDVDQDHPAWCARGISCTADTTDEDLEPLHRSAPLTVHRETDDHGQYRLFIHDAPREPGDQYHPAILVQRFEEPPTEHAQWWRAESIADEYLEPREAAAVVAALVALLDLIDPDYRPGVTR